MVVHVYLYYYPDYFWCIFRRLLSCRLQCVHVQPIVRQLLLVKVSLQAIVV